MRTAILFVDDEKTVLDSLKQQVRHLFGARLAVETAENVAEAWEVIEELHEDGVRIVVVVSDWLMPGTRGDEFLAEVRGRHPEIARIMLTGQADAAAIQRAHDEAEVQQVLHKPWAVADLRKALEQAIAP